MWRLGTLCLSVPFASTSFKLADVGSVEQEPTSITTPKAPSLRKGNVTLHVAGKAGSVACTWLVDTGADVTCISSQLPGVQDLRLSPPTSIPAASNLTKLDCLGEVVTTIKIGHITKPAVRVLVVRELNVSAILGLDVLHDYERMSVNWKNQTLELGGHLIKLEKRLFGAPRQSVEVRLIRDQLIPARSQCFVQAAAVDFGSLNRDTFFSPYQEKMAQQDILLGSAVVKHDLKNEVPVVA